MPVAGSKVLESATRVSVQVIARLLMISERRVQQLANEGVIPRTESRRYNLEESVQAYIQFLQGKNVGRAMADEQIDFHEEKARLTKIQADKAQLELDEVARSLVKAEEVSREWYNAVSDCKGRLLSIPSKAAPIVAAETSTGACSAVVFGNWSDVVVGFWSSGEFLVDQYSKMEQGIIWVRGLSDIDVGIRHAESFAAIQDVTTA